MESTRPHARRRFVVRALLFALTLAFGALHVAQVAERPRPGVVPWDVRLESRWVERELADPSHGWSRRFFPEGELFEHEFHALALANIAETTHDPEDVSRAVKVLREELAAIDGEVVHHPPLNVMERWELRGGIMAFGGQNLLRAELLELAPDATPAEVARFHADSATLARLYARSPAGLLDSMPGATWPADNVFAWRSLQLHDARYGTQYARAFAKLRAALERGRDRRTGLAPSAVSLDGVAEDVPRGCALSWSLSTLPALDPTYAAAQWKAYRARFFRCAGGLCLVREYPPGVDRHMDVDSGPMIDGLGMAASGLGLAAARANGDLEAAAALQRSGELIGVPGIGFWGKRYWGGGAAFFDVLALWAKTVPLPASARGDAPALPPAVIILTLCWLALAVAQLPRLLRARRKLAAAHTTSKVQLGLELASYAAFALLLAWPALRLLELIALLALLDWTSDLVAILARWRRAPVASAACVDSASPSQP